MAAEDAPHVLADEVGPHPPPLHELVADIAVDHAVLVPRRRRRPQRITREVGCSINGITTYLEGLAWTWLNSLRRLREIVHHSQGSQEAEFTQPSFYY